MNSLFPRPLVHRIRNCFVYRFNKVYFLLFLLLLGIFFIISNHSSGITNSFIPVPKPVDPYEDTKPYVVEVNKRSQSYEVDPHPTCWGLDCQLPNNYHAKKECKNIVATKWNILGVESMERYLSGDRTTDNSDSDYMNTYLPQAAEHFINAITEDPECCRAHANLGLVYMEQGKTQSSLHHLTEAINLNPTEARYYAIRSFLYEIMGNNNERIKDREKAESLDKYIGERKYFGILLCNTTEPHRYIRWPMIVQYTPAAEINAARKVLLYVEFSKTSISNYALIQPGVTDFFVENKYIVLRKIIPPFVLREIQNCYRTGIRTKRIGFMDDQAIRFVAQNDRCGRLLLFNFVDLVRKTIAHNARPAYSYFGGYVNGSVLNPHSDRPQCEFTFSITIEQNPFDQPWGLGMYRVPQFEKNDNWPGRDKEPWPEEKDQIWADLFEGDGLLFMGRHMIHFRKGHLLGKGRWLNQVFLHYVQENFRGTLD